jgi:hypothetical protein
MLYEQDMNEEAYHNRSSTDLWIRSDRIWYPELQMRSANVWDMTSPFIHLINPYGQLQARFLLMHNPEFTAIGAETKINYQANYNFYLERLFECMPWACGVTDYFNKKVFGATNQSCIPAPGDSPTDSQP